MELIQEVSEDKKLTTFLEKRTKEYEKEMSCSESAQHYKNEVEVFLFLQCYYYLSYFIVECIQCYN